jgi:hypothetical protein
MKARTDTPMANQFKHLSFEEALRVYGVADGDKNNTMNLFLQKKYTAAVRNVPLNQRSTITAAFFRFNRF